MWFMNMGPATTASAQFMGSNYFRTNDQKEANQINDTSLIKHNSSHDSFRLLFHLDFFHTAAQTWTAALIRPVLGLSILGFGSLRIRAVTHIWKQIQELLDYRMKLLNYKHTHSSIWHGWGLFPMVTDVFSSGYLGYTSGFSLSCMVFFLGAVSPAVLLNMKLHLKIH